MQFFILAPLRIITLRAIILFSTYPCIREPLAINEFDTEQSLKYLVGASSFTLVYMSPFLKIVLY